MGYIGATPSNNFINTDVQRITGSTNNYIDLDHSISSLDSIIVYVNNVRQESTNLTFTSASRITLGDTLTASDVCEVIFLGKAVATQTPDNGTITLDMLSASGTKSSSTFLRGDNTFSTVTSTTINNNADNRVITGSGTANTLEGESNLTYSSPDLTVTGGNPSIIHNNTTSGGDSGIKFQGSGTNYGFINLDNSDGALDLGTSVGWSTRFYTNNSERMRFRSSGTASFNDSAATNTKNDWAIKLLQNTNDSATNYMMVFANSSDVTLGSIQTNGTSSTSFNTSSDYRLKENEVAISDGIERLKQLKPYRFNFKADADKTVDGFFAHEVSSVVPEAISGEKDAVDSEGNPIYQGIDQSKIVPLLTAALKEAITKIETLEARVQTLEDA